MCVRVCVRMNLRIVDIIIIIIVKDKAVTAETLYAVTISFYGKIEMAL